MRFTHAKASSDKHCLTRNLMVEGKRTICESKCMHEQN